MKKRRSTVYVRPGKDVTLYVPVETPPEVVDYLNELKQEGMFSQGIIDILSEYVQRRGHFRRLESGVPAQAVPEEPTLGQTGMSWSRIDVSEPQTPLPSSVSQPTDSPLEPLESESSLSTGDHLGAGSMTAGSMTAGSMGAGAGSSSSDSVADSNRSGHEPSPAKLNLAQIFQQAQRNSGKLME